MVIGDFNEVMGSFEHFSNRQRSAKQMLDFKEVLSHCDLHDIGFIGLPRTYNNNKKGERNVTVRLDRAVALPRWSDWFLNAKVQHIVSSRSDHCPIFLNLEKEVSMQRGYRLFWYEIMWER
jgi:exonuclease III